MSGNTHRLAQLDVPEEAADRAVAAIVRALETEGPLSRYQLAERVQERHAPLHLLFRAALRGLVVRGPVRGRQHCYVLGRDWLGGRPRIDRDRALADLARRFLAAGRPPGAAASAAGRAHRPRARRSDARRDIAVQGLLARYVAAHEAGDYEAMVELLHDEVAMTMPPRGSVHRPRCSLRRLRMLLGPQGPGEWRIVPIEAKQPATAN